MRATSSGLLSSPAPMRASPAPCIAVECLFSSPTCSMAFGTSRCRTRHRHRLRPSGSTLDHERGSSSRFVWPWRAVRLNSWNTIPSSAILPPTIGIGRPVHELCFGSNICSASPPALGAPFRIILNPSGSLPPNWPICVRDAPTPFRFLHFQGS